MPAAGPQGTGTAASPFTDAPPWELAVNLYSFTLDCPAAEAVRRLADIGVGTVELMMYPGHLWPDARETVSALQRAGSESGIRFLSCNMPNIDLNIAAASREMREYSLGLIQSFVEVAAELGVPNMVLSPGKPNPLFPAPHEVLAGHLRAALDRLVPVAAKGGVTLLIENVPFGFVPDAASLMDMVEAYGDDRIGITYDIANAHFIGEDPAQGLRRVQRCLRLIHLSDTTRTSFRHDPLGLGDVPLASLPAALREIGYARPIVLEIVSRDPAREIAESASALAALWGAGGRAPDGEEKMPA